MLVSIVIPAFNEEKGIEKHLSQILAFAQNQTWDFELIVVNDGSTDQTQAKLENFKKNLPLKLGPKLLLLALPQNRGKGAAVRTGMLAAQGDVCGFTDADGSTPIGELNKVLPLLQSQCDIVIGTRAIKSTETQVKAFWHRRIMGRIFRWMFQPFVQINDFRGRMVKDTQCGFKWFRKAAAKDVFARQTIDGFAFDVEILHLANCLNYSLYELPVNWVDGGRSSVHLLWDPLKMLWQVLTISIKHRGLKKNPAKISNP